MKKYAIPVLSIALNIVLLLFVKNLSGQVSDLQLQIQNLESDVDRKITREVNDLRNDLEKDARLYESYELQPTGLDSTTQSLLADFDLQLKQWSADTAVTLFVGNETISLVAGEPGHFTAPLSLPIAQSGEVLLNIDITTNGVTTREYLGGWSDISMLLPLQMNGWGWGNPSYENGALTLRELSAAVQTRDHVSVRAQGVEFYVYINGERACTAPAALYDFDYYSYSCDKITLEGVKVGDEVTVAFSCRDEYGLHYEFELYTWTVVDTRDQNSFTAAGGDNIPKLSWD